MLKRRCFNVVCLLDSQLDRYFALNSAAAKNCCAGSALGPDRKLEMTCLRAIKRKHLHQERTITNLWWLDTHCRVNAFLYNVDCFLILFLVYKKVSLVWGVDRKIRSEDHCLASRGLPSDARLWSRGTDFSIYPSHPWWILFLAYLSFPNVDF